MVDFIHLHNHSDFSLLDGAQSVQSMVKKAQQLGMKHLALTDHGNMFGAVNFYQTCKEGGINPIVGSEFYVTPLSRHDKSSESTKHRNQHLVLLAKNDRGYRNLLKLSSLSYTEGFYYRPRIDFEVLEQYSSDLVASSACLAGEIAQLVLHEDIDQAVKRAHYYQDLFGKGNYFLELQDHGIPEQKIANKGIIEVARRTGISLIATNDCHYPERSDAIAQDVLICIATGKKLNDSDRLRFSYPEFYFKSGEEMLRIFSEIPEAIRNTMAIGEMCNLDLQLPGPLLPDYELPQGHSYESYFRHISYEGLKRRYPKITDELTTRLDYEIDIITKMDFIGYFLIVWDFIRHAKQNNIPVGPGRGSGAGSLVAYCLEITDIDPLKYNLLFERFLNPDRVSMPDFDIDFCFERRQEVIEYVTQKYGKEKVGQIITFGTLKAKAAVKDVARVLDFPFTEANEIAKLIPAGPKVTLEKALEMEPKFQEMRDKGEKFKELIDISLKLEGLRRHASTHAAGIVIGKTELTEYVPLYRDSKTGSISTQFTMDYLEQCGLVKMDFLGLKTLTVIQNTIDLIKKRGIEVDFTKVSDEDKATFKLLGEGKSTCIFQFESSGMQNILKQAKPNTIEDLIALNALYRPGPMENIDQFIEGKFNPKKIKYPLPELEPILKDTYGVIVYQEQVMEIARKVAGFSLGQADILRRAMGKKKVQVMNKMKEMFVEGALKQGYSQKVADDIFELLIPFAGYGFNKSHAAAYSVLAYQTAYLKANFPAEFMAANLTNEITNPDKLAEYIREVREMHIEIKPPDINLSEKLFTVVDGKIVYGIKGVKNVGSAAVEAIIRERDKGPYEDFIHFLERVDLKVVNKKVLETLIQCGLFDSMKQNRATLFSHLEQMMEVAGNRKERKMYGQSSLFDNFEDAGFQEIQINPVAEYPQKQLLDWEKQFLGFFFSGHPLDKYAQMIKLHSTLDLSKAAEAIPSEEYTLIGILKSTREIMTKTGKKMAFGLMEDFKGAIELVFFSKPFEKYQNILVTDQVLAIKGKIDLSRGDPKLLVDSVHEIEDMSDEPAPPPKRFREVHILLSGSFYNTENLQRLREYCQANKGGCELFLHTEENGRGKVIKAGNDIRVSASESFIEKLYDYDQVSRVWKV
ncbi:MAG: DNA polymerase III subunit alpha [Spirochaetales bacterium]|nr:DNA polymerase III subunit alpha [Spirochaetales bacterium]